jgi:preprotein translocase subunit SecG
MEVVVLVIHLFVALALTATILLQRSEGGGLGIGGGGTGGGLFSARGAANALTRATAMLAAAFFVTSITLTLMARHGTTPTSIISEPGAPVTAPGTPPPLDPLSALGGSSTPAAPTPTPGAPAAPAPDAATPAAEPPAAAPPASAPPAETPPATPPADTSDVPVPTSKPNSQ